MFAQAETVLSSVKLWIRLAIDTNLEKFQKKLFKIIDSFSLLWKGLDDFKKSPDETVTFPLGCFHTLQ